MWPINDQILSVKTFFVFVFSILIGHKNVSKCLLTFTTISVPRLFLQGPIEVTIALESDDTFAGTEFEEEERVNSRR